MLITRTSRIRSNVERRLSQVRLARVGNSMVEKKGIDIEGHDNMLNGDVEEKLVVVGRKEQSCLFLKSHLETMVAYCSTICVELSKCRMELQKGMERILFSQ